jgi:hypothetical protein
MPRICTIYTHDDAHAINVALVHRDAYRHTASRYEVSTGALQRHAHEHLPELLMRARDAVEVAEADSLLDRVESFYKRIEAILEAAESNSEWGTALQAIKECRGNLELLGRVTKELQDAPSLHLHFNPEWLERRAVIVGIRPCPRRQLEVVGVGGVAVASGGWRRRRRRRCRSVAGPAPDPRGRGGSGLLRARRSGRRPSRGSAAIAGRGTSAL